MIGPASSRYVSNRHIYRVLGVGLTWETKRRKLGADMGIDWGMNFMVACRSNYVSVQNISNANDDSAYGTFAMAA